MRKLRNVMLIFLIIGAVFSITIGVLFKYYTSSIGNDEEVEVGISLCQGIVSKTGSIIITSTQGIGTHMTHFPPVFIIIATTSQIYPSYRQVLSHLPETPPKWVISIRSGKLISEEIKELYLFVTEM